MKAGRRRNAGEKFSKLSSETYLHIFIYMTVSIYVCNNMCMTYKYNCTRVLASNPYTYIYTYVYMSTNEKRNTERNPSCSHVPVLHKYFINTHTYISTKQYMWIYALYVIIYLAPFLEPVPVYFADKCTNATNSLNPSAKQSAASCPKAIPAVNCAELNSSIGRTMVKLSTNVYLLFYVIISVATSTRLASPPQKQSHFTRQRAQAEKF